MTFAIIFDIVLQLLNYVAQTEWEINHRQVDGIAARAPGALFGWRSKDRGDYETVLASW